MWNKIHLKNCLPFYYDDDLSKNIHGTIPLTQNGFFFTGDKIAVFGANIFGIINELGKGSL